MTTINIGTPTKKIYEGVPLDGTEDNNGRVLVKNIDEPYELDMHKNVERMTALPHFQWGTPNGGSAQLALAILIDASDDIDLALRHYLQFTREYTATLPPGEWTISAFAVSAWLDILELEGGKQANGA